MLLSQRFKSLLKCICDQNHFKKGIAIFESMFCLQKWQHIVMYSIGLVDVALSRIYPAGLPTSGRPVVDVGVADCLTLPLRTSSYDGVLCIAVLHHISNPCRRAAVLKEISRILIMKSRALVTVWAEEQENPTKTIAKWTPISDSPGQGLYATCI